MNKTFAAIKALGAGVTALYHAVESAKHSTEGEGTEAYEAARRFENAGADFTDALGELQAKPKPHQPYHFNGAGSVKPVFHGSDNS